MRASHRSFQITQGATKVGFWDSREYSSGALNPKVVLGEMGGSGGKGLTEVQVLGENSGRYGATPRGCEGDGSPIRICPALGVQRYSEDVEARGVVWS